MGELAGLDPVSRVAVVLPLPRAEWLPAAAPPDMEEAAVRELGERTLAQVETEVRVMAWRSCR